MLYCKVHRRAAGRAGIFDVEHRNAFDTDLAEYDLARDRQLPLKLAIGDAGVEGRTDGVGTTAGVLQGAA
ncbi:hypothetical protein D3C87_1925650 [compost metagenome]